MARGDLYGAFLGLQVDQLRLANRRKCMRFALNGAHSIAYAPATWCTHVPDYLHVECADQNVDPSFEVYYVIGVLKRR